MGLRHLHIVQDDGTRQRGALAEGRPVVDDGRAWRIALGNRIPGTAFRIEGDDRHQMGEQRTGGIECLAVDDNVVAGIGELRLEIRRPLNEPRPQGRIKRTGSVYANRVPCPERKKAPRHFCLRGFVNFGCGDLSARRLVDCNLNRAGERSSIPISLKTRPA